MAEPFELASGHLTDLRVGKILAGLLSDMHRGQRIDKSMLETQYPELADELWGNLQLAQRLGHSKSSVESLVRLGRLRPSTEDGWQAELGPFKIAELIGQGGMGIVLRAFEPQLNRWVALKLLRPELTDDPDARARFETEARAGARLQHPHVATVYQVAEEDGTHYLAAELIPGLSLEQLLRASGPLPATDCKRTLRQVLSGLEAAHTAGVIHRDLKPSNVILNEARSSAKIVDFGLARIVDARSRITLPAAVFGTPLYMSPEQITGAYEVDPRTDLYAAGVILFEMLTGQPPFQSAVPWAISHSIVYEDPPFPSKIYAKADESLGALALRLMAKRPSDRFDSATQALEALEHAGRGRFRFRGRQTHQEIRRIGMGGLAILLFMIASWVVVATIFRAGSGAEGRGRFAAIAALKVDQHDHQPTGTLLARFGVDPTWKVLLTLPETAGAIRTAGLAQVAGGQDHIIVVGPAHPEQGRSLIFYDPNGAELGFLDLSAHRSWLDSGAPAYWTSAAQLAADLDGAPGDELIVAANEYGGYAGRVSLIDLKTRKVTKTFWHLGNIDGMELVQDFLGPGHSAILAYGSNNKLDGFNDETGPSLTDYDIVSFVALLDLRNLNGLGPPPTDRMADLEPCTPVAYAFLDAATSHTHDARDRGALRARRDVLPQETASIKRAHMGNYQKTDPYSPLFWVDIVGPDGDTGCTLVVDRNLDFREVIGRRENAELDKFCRQRWKPIVREGRYLSR